MEKGDMSLKQLKKRLPDIRQWAEDRNLIAGSTTAAQFVKLVEEAGEMLLAHENDDPDGVKDGAGDVIVVLTILAAQIGANLEDHIKFHDGDGYIYGDVPMFGKLASAIARKQHDVAIEHICEIAGCAMGYAWEHGFDITDCVEHAWAEIKDRKGKMIDGVFVKDGD